MVLQREFMRPLLKSYRGMPPGRQIGPVPEDEPIDLTVVFKPAAPLTPTAPEARITRREYRDRFATPKEPMDRLQDYATQHGLAIMSADAARHTIRLQGTYGRAAAAFRAENTGTFEYRGRRFEARWGHLFVPATVHDWIVAILGFDARGKAKPHVQASSITAPRYHPKEVAERYGLPIDRFDGNGETIALISLDGGFRQSDVDVFFRNGRSGLVVAVPPEANIPSEAFDARAEVMMDICIAGAIAPGADIALYIGRDSQSARDHTGFLHVIQDAIQDSERNPSILCVTWGDAEVNWDSAGIAAFEQAFLTAAQLGMTICIASGDQGALDNAHDHAFCPQFPASSPSVIACGGTSLPALGKETAWSNSGGGFSRNTPLPDYQIGLVTSPSATRGVPDVAGNADIGTGYRIFLDGAEQVVGGTSAVAPLWAAFIALINQGTSNRVGFLNRVLYRNATSFTDIETGDNGYPCCPGWDPVTGLGTPTKALADALLTTFQGA